MRYRRSEEMPVGGTVIPAEATQPRTGGWRLGLKPRVDLSRCVNCLLCWVYCPDSAVIVRETTFYGFDYEFCKGCEVCAEACPTDAIAMVDESTSVPPYGLAREPRGGDR